MGIIEIFFAVVTAVVGWVVGHRFTSKRDLENSRRAARIQALTTCYKALVRSGIDGVMLKRNASGAIINNAVPVEDAIALVHLYGDSEQSALASAYSSQVAQTGEGNPTVLVNSLRRDVRSMLGTADVSADPVYLSVRPREDL